MVLNEAFLDFSIDEIKEEKSVNAFKNRYEWKCVEIRRLQQQQQQQP